MGHTMGKFKLSDIFIKYAYLLSNYTYLITISNNYTIVNLSVS